MASSSEGQAGDGHGAERGAEAGGHHGRSEAFAGDVRDGDQEAAVGLLDDVEIVAANLVAGDGAEGDRVAGDFRQFLRQERTLDVARGVEVLLDAGPLQVALVVAGVFKGDGGLQDQAFDEVGFVKSQFAAVGRGDDQFRHPLAFAILQEIERKRGTVFGLLGGIGNFAIAEAGAGECGARHFELANDDAKHCAEHGFFANGGVNLARRLEQRL